MILSLLLSACTAGPVADTGDTGADRLLFAFPVLERDAIGTPVMGVDHDPEDHEGIEQIVCTNYAGEAFPHCYDGHSGSDFLLDGGFEAMDAGSATVIAAAEGVVVATEDGNYDRCHADAATFDVTCDGHEMVSNHVVVEHAGGWRTSYHHLMNGSVLVQVGDEVQQGTPLARVGSSGYSSTPHLHFGFEDPEGTRLDPFAGEHSQDTSWWCEQGPVEGLPGDCP